MSHPVRQLDIYLPLRLIGSKKRLDRVIHWYVWHPIGHTFSTHGCATLDTVIVLETACNPGKPIGIPFFLGFQRASDAHVQDRPFSPLTKSKKQSRRAPDAVSDRSNSQKLNNFSPNCVYAKEPKHRVSSVCIQLTRIARKQAESAQPKQGQRFAGDLASLFGALVPKVGLEPTSLAAADFESAASTIPPLGPTRLLYPAPQVPSTRLKHGPKDHLLKMYRNQPIGPSRGP